jgi:hypothetical protein
LSAISLFPWRLSVGCTAPGTMDDGARLFQGSRPTSGAHKADQNATLLPCVKRSLTRCAITGLNT